MNTRRGNRFLVAAYKVLMKAGRSMHYTQITAVALELGLLHSKGQTAAISMSSLLSQDIRTNPTSRFVRERSGVYALADLQIGGDADAKTKDSEATQLLDELCRRTGISDTRRVIDKALYLTGRTLDVAGEGHSLVYRYFEAEQGIEVDVSELAGDVTDMSDDGTVVWKGQLAMASWRKAERLATRLDMSHPKLAIYLSLFLLDVALDVVGEGSLLVIESGEACIRIPVRSVGVPLDSLY